MPLSLLPDPGNSGDPVPLVWGDAVTDNIDEMVGILTPPTSAWTVFTPTWASTGTAPALGNGSISGKYMQFGKVGFFDAALITGGTTTYGTGTYTFTLPVGWTAASVTNTLVGDGVVLDTSTSIRYIGALAVVSTTTVTLFTHAAATAVSGTVPVTLASGDVIRWRGLIELA